LFQVNLNNKHFTIEHHGFQIENEVFWSGITNGWEKISMQLWVELCKSSDVILDVGANTGIYSLVAKTIKPTSLVYGFEPVKRVFEKYKKNCQLNNYDIHCSEIALSDYDGEGVIYDTTSEHTYSVAVNKNIALDGISTIETKIEVRRLSSFIIENQIKKIDLIKIDVETHEVEVLKGMDKYLQAFQPTLLIEILNDEIGEKIQELIKDIDYLFFNIDEKNPPMKVDKIVKSNYYNYLICKKEIALRLNLI
jgi:FkbM family methyltransferase